jgi:hypothetical protein
MMTTADLPVANFFKESNRNKIMIDFQPHESVRLARQAIYCYLLFKPKHPLFSKGGHLLSM